ncbi:MAG: hypothetical protein AAF694_25765 [Bacteroidota bacterium]
MKILSILSTLGAALSIIACSENSNTDRSTPIHPGDDPHFTIVAHSDPGFSSFNRKVVVFGIDLYAVPSVEDDKLLHAANLMAQYLDNDEDGQPDNQAVLESMLAEQAFLVMWDEPEDLDPIIPPPGREGQDLGNDETNPAYVTQGKWGRFDAALEEVLHLITHSGYALVYPDIFGEHMGSQLAQAMDLARGGKFTTIPNPYPAEAWYSYDDATCTYDCQITEYHYWALTSLLGAQENRLEEIEQEWKLNTHKKVQSRDTAVYRLLTHPSYKFPSVLPDGTYRH